MIKTHPLNSSMLVSCQYDTDSSQLSVKFSGSGKVYRSAQPVPEAIYEGLIDADSAGKYYNAKIKGVYGMVADA